MGEEQPLGVSIPKELYGRMRRHILEQQLIGHTILQKDFVADAIAEKLARLEARK